MAASQTSYFNSKAGAVTITGTTETVAGTSRQVNSSYFGCQILVRFSGEIDLGADQNSAVVKIYRGATAAGTLLYTSGALSPGTIAAAPTVAAKFTFCADVVDQPAGDIASQIYCVTVTQAGGTGNGQVINIASQITVGE